MPALLSLLAALTIAAPPPSLVRDLDDTPASGLRDRTTSSTQEWDPWVAVLPTGVLFEAAGSDGAIRLWTSDGTAAEAPRLSDFPPALSAPTRGASRAQYARLGAGLFWNQWGF